MIVLGLYSCLTRSAGHNLACITSRLGINTCRSVTAVGQNAGLTKYSRRMSPGYQPRSPQCHQHYRTPSCSSFPTTIQVSVIADAGYFNKSIGTSLPPEPVSKMVPRPSPPMNQFSSLATAPAIRLRRNRTLVAMTLPRCDSRPRPTTVPHPVASRTLRMERSELGLHKEGP
ncbi:hypothetical protein GGR57DRAFT_477018 [Xylariaceae sp. FL1272]|nr:hypothetical protein GGR57DRAFT_477018 [Xylariaceae sp. FL1272]